MVLFIFLTSFTMIALGTGSLFLAFFISVFVTCFVSAFTFVAPSAPVTNNQQNPTSQNSTVVNSEVNSECEDDDDDLLLEMHKRMRCHSHAAIGYRNVFGGSGGFGRF